MVSNLTNEHEGDKQGVRNKEGGILKAGLPELEGSDQGYQPQKRPRRRWYSHEKASGPLHNFKAIKNQNVFVVDYTFAALKSIPALNLANLQA